MTNSNIKTIFALALAIISPVAVGLILEITLISIFNKWCLFDPWHLLFKNKAVYSYIVPLSLASLGLLPKIVGYLDIAEYKKLTSYSLTAIVLCASIGFFYFGAYYGNYGVGACIDPNVNFNYYKHPGQSMYLK